MERPVACLLALLSTPLTMRSTLVLAGEGDTGSPASLLPDEAMIALVVLAALVLVLGLSLFVFFVRLRRAERRLAKLEGQDQPASTTPPASQDAWSACHR